MTTILLVDDSVTDRTRAAGLIRRAHGDWDVLAVPSAEQALLALAHRHIDVVVSDLVMPDMDGRQLLQIMSRDYPLTPVVLVTSQGDDQIAAECIGLGAVNYVAKAKLATHLAEILEGVLQSEAETTATRQVLQHVVQNRFQFEIDSDLDQIRALVNFVRERLHALQMFSAGKVRDISTAIREALLNAHFHGNLQVNARPLQLSRPDYLAIARERGNDDELTGRQIRLSMVLNQDTITFRVSDDGPGFDLQQIKDLSGPDSDQFANGNGVRRMRSLMHQVKYNATGNEVTLVEHVSP